MISTVFQQSNKSNLYGYEDNSEQALQKLRAEHQKFCSLISHDLNAPLRAIIGFSELLANRYGDQLDDNAREYLSFLQDGGHQMQAMLGDLLEFSRVSSLGKEPELISAEQTLESALTALDTSSVKFTISWDKLPMVAADDEQLERVFRYLLDNSIKHAVKNWVSVHVSAQRIDDYWQFLVQDNGSGVPVKEQERIFEAFQKLGLAHDSTAGTGMGLTIVRQIVHRHGGTIHVHSTGKSGSTFIFSWPANRATVE